MDKQEVIQDIVDHLDATILAAYYEFVQGGIVDPDDWLEIVEEAIQKFKEPEK